MKIIGGDASLKDDSIYTYITDSGRSSLRLILTSRLKGKKFLIPDYLCRSVLDVFNENGVSYDFYRVRSDLTINKQEIKNKKYDVLYLINYFGNKRNIAAMTLRKGIIILEDNVFLPIFNKPAQVTNWIGFNSFRKISSVPEGSVVKSTIKLNERLISKEESLFARLKYDGMHTKYAYMQHKKYSENKYLRLFARAEKLIDRQRSIYSISSRGCVHLFEFNRTLETEYLIRQKNYETLDRYLKRYSIPIRSVYYSFYVFCCDRRDALREYLKSKKIYLPLHWPNPGDINNSLYQKVMSIPVDSRYDNKDMRAVAGLIKQFLRA
ncbi:MAG: hypothetical protein ABII23_06990 [bacterium]